MIQKFRTEQCPRCGAREVKVVNPLWLRATRERAGLSLRELARRAGFTASYLCDIELGRRRVTRSMAALYERIPR